MINIYNPELDCSNYFIATYELASLGNLGAASWNLAIGQSVGNPNVRNSWETDELFEKHSCIILHERSELEKTKSGTVSIAFPDINIDFEEDGISQLLCMLMGGQMDIDSITQCRLIDLKLSENSLKLFKGPKFGIKGIRKYLGINDKPLLGGIVKPKTGISPETLLEMVKELVYGGVNFIKEDEILSNPSFCPLEKRVEMISNFISSSNHKIVYSACINSNPFELQNRVKSVYEAGGNSVHVNIWSGLGAYQSIRNLDLPIFIHYQKSGDKVITDKSHRFSISWEVLCYLAGISGVDFIHAGMYGGYSTTEELELQETLRILHKHDVMPALSCGMHPGLVEIIREKFGNDWMANVGGAIHGHPKGTLAGAKAMRQSIDRKYGHEYDVAIKKWGLVK